jgi:hypothetical protein
MTNSYQQRAQQRKLIYAGLIVGLFTAAWLYRDNVVYAQADKMQLREVTKGEVELTSSVLRHTLSGLHGLGVTILWSTAIEKQKKHEWNELELLVNSITRLQPYFITPWRFQGWNLAFNVSVECDSPVDKYYYITRGLTLLAQGERRNQGTPEKGQYSHPGNPDLRRDIGIFYQMKIGTSDDKYTMRCLLDLSCIDPVERSFDLTQSGNSISGDSELGKKLKTFCYNYPSLTRRIIERLDKKDTAREFIQFLEDNKEVPTRFEALRPGEKSSRLKPVDDQWPILPRPDAQEAEFWPDPREQVLTNEVISVYLMARTWFLYAQKPLPPPDNFYDKVVDKKKRYEQIDPAKYRASRMADVLFRSDPCRAQAFMAETLQEEGWFDGEGWTLRSTFMPKMEPQTIGALKQFRSGRLWSKAYEMYKDFGTQTGLYLTERQKVVLEGMAQPFREEYKLGEDQDFQAVRSDLLERDGYLAHLALRYHRQRRGMSNFDAHIYSAEAEMDPETIQARKMYYDGQKIRPESNSTYLRITGEANYLWMDILLKYPRFAQVRTNQEDTYERQLKYMARQQLDRQLATRYADIILLGFELMPHHFPVGLPWVPQYFQLGLPWASYVHKEKGRDVDERFLLDSQLDKLIPIRRSNPIWTGIRSPFEMMQYYDSPKTPDLKNALCLWTAGANMPCSPLAFFPAALNPARHMGLMTSSSLGEFTAGPPFPGALPGETWRFLVDQEAVAVVRSRRGLR